MRVYLIRHSIPEPSKDYEENPDPGLTDEGCKLVEALAKWMADTEELPSLIYASPMQRTMETAEILRDKLSIMPRVAADMSIGPAMSIRGLIRRVAEDKSAVRIGIVSHHESIEHGLRVLNRDPWVHLDIFAQCELRIIKVDREAVTWHEHNRMLPSDLGLYDYY